MPPTPETPAIETAKGPTHETIMDVKCPVCGGPVTIKRKIGAKGRAMGYCSNTLADGKKCRAVVTLDRHRSKQATAIKRGAPDETPIEQAIRSAEPRAESAPKPAVDSGKPESWRPSRGIFRRNRPA